MIFFICSVVVAVTSGVYDIFTAYTTKFSLDRTTHFCFEETDYVTTIKWLFLPKAVFVFLAVLAYMFGFTTVAFSGVWFMTGAWIFAGISNKKLLRLVPVDKKLNTLKSKMRKLEEDNE